VALGDLGGSRVALGSFSWYQGLQVASRGHGGLGGFRMALGGHGWPRGFVGSLRDLQVTSGVVGGFWGRWWLLGSLVV
jgi:hypothetical protein